MLLREKRCHSLFICLFTEPDREEVHSQTMRAKNLITTQGTYCIRINMVLTMPERRGVPVNRPTCLCIENNLQFTYLIIYDIFTFKILFENESPLLCYQFL